MVFDLSENAIPLFLRAGWFFGRRVPVDEAIPPDHVAASVLAEFGGLHVGAENRGRMFPEVYNDIEFCLVRESGDIISDWESLLGTTLVGIGEFHHGHGELYVSTDGRVFEASLMHDAFAFQDKNFVAAIDGLLFGKRSIPMIRPDQESVTWYGVEYKLGDPGLYDYAMKICRRDFR